MLFGREAFGAVPFSTAEDEPSLFGTQYSVIDQSDAEYLVTDHSESVIPDVPDFGISL